MKLLILSGLVIVHCFAGCAQHGSPGSSAPVVAFVGDGRRTEILALFDRWNQSLATGDPRAVAANYAPDAVLLPTVSNKVRRTDAERVEYFEHFLQKGPQGKIDRAFVRTNGAVAINSGLYTFTFRDGSTVRARYTFVYQKQPDGKWLIIEHHSSKFPE